MSNIMIIGFKFPLKGVLRGFQGGKMGKINAMPDKEKCILLRLIFVQNYHNDMGFIHKNPEQ